VIIVSSDEMIQETKDVRYDMKRERERERERKKERMLL